MLQMTASRHEVSLSSGALLDQQTSELDIELTNLQSADAGNENFVSVRATAC